MTTSADKLYISKTRLVLCVVVCVAALVWSVLWVPQGDAQTVDKLSPRERRGKQIYLRGEGEQPDEIAAILGGSDLEMPGTSFPCASCHGQTGAGTKEGGIQPPPVNWTRLTAPHLSELTRRERRPYTEAFVARAISLGLDPAGAPLHGAMPRYKMTPGQMADLLAYLRKLGTEADADPGLDDAAIRIGAAVPLSGPLAPIGEDIKASLAAYFAEINARGGIYGRRFQLIVEDSRGEAAQTLEATRRLVEHERVFALVGSFEPANSSATNDFLKRSEAPLVGPVTLSPRRLIPPNPYLFYLLPTFGDQARALVDFIALRPVEANRQARLAVIFGNSDFDRDALAGLISQAKIHSMEIVAEESYDKPHFSPEKVALALAQKRPDYIFFFGTSEEITTFARAMESANVSAALLTSIVMLGRGAFDLPPTVAARTFLSYPAALPDENGFAEFTTVMLKTRVGVRSPAFQAVAYAAAKTFVQATKLSGRQLSRAALLSSLEQLRDFETGVVPPVTFGPNRRVGVVSSHIVGVDLAKKQYTPVGERIVPKDRP